MVARSSASTSMSAYPTITFNGVRSSCETFATSRDRISTASRARPSAVRSWSCACRSVVSRSNASRRKRETDRAPSAVVVNTERNAMNPYGHGIDVGRPLASTPKNPRAQMLPITSWWPTSKGKIAGTAATRQMSAAIAMFASPRTRG